MALMKIQLVRFIATANCANLDVLSRSSQTIRTASVELYCRLLILYTANICETACWRLASRFLRQISFKRTVLCYFDVPKVLILLI